jgi:hypothetical protein
MIGNLRRRKPGKMLLLAFAMTLVSTAGWGATYYVSTSGSDTSAGSRGSPWRTVQKAADRVVAGDNVVVLPGTYMENVTTKSGGLPNQYITFAAGGNVALTRFNIAHDWVRIDGFRFSGYAAANESSIFIGGSNVQVLNSAILGTGADVYGILSKYTLPYPNNVLIKGNVLDGLMFHNIVLFVTNSTVENNEIRNTSMDVFRIWGHDVLIRANYVHDIVDDPVNHADFIQTFGYDDEDAYNIVIDGNLMVNSFAQPCNLSNDNSLRQHDWIFRNNVYYRVAGTCNVGIPNVSFYNNTFYDCSYHNDSFAIGFLSQTGFNGNNGIVKNNIFIGSNRSTTGWYTKSANLTLTADYNYVASLAPSFGAKAGFSEPHGVNGGDPKFRDLSGLDFHLSYGGKGIDAGTAIPGFAYDKDGAPRPAGGAWDIGAYEYQGPFGKKPLPPTSVYVNP